MDPFGLLTYNKSPPDTVPVTGHTAFMLQCVESCLQRKSNNSSLDLLVTGGAETSGHSKNSYHYSNQACDVAGPNFNPVNGNDVTECATSCGFGAGQYETFQNQNRNHWHLQTVPGNGVPALPRNLPSS
ncbi:hypothetical protein [Sideroxydans sp. CL21]|uniref:hypothetical protein n=1 Tax=Sideroxydans sp. CL21 TaxID=2600596 RepID=UPI0024BD448C|nr:hypothetical protein [Sideroxydans sp. CL21]